MKRGGNACRAGWLAAVFLSPQVAAAADPSAPSGIALIPAGDFEMGNSTNPEDSGGWELPVHKVHVSAFFMDRYEVTKALWDAVRAWGLSRGYTDLPQGSMGGSTDFSKGATYPVHWVTWYDVVKWSNARSEKENLTPAYYTNDAQTAVYRVGSVNVANAQVKWQADGYRLPTEAEWEKAARGGLSSKRFPWGGTISHTQANYHSRSNLAYDISPSRGYHPGFLSGGTPYLSPVGSFPPNDYGLSDMAGNVWEWCWDWYSSTWYSQGGATATDPHGPSPGPTRVLRGGSWIGDAFRSRVAYRGVSTPGFAYSSHGFRCVRQ